MANCTLIDGVEPLNVTLGEDVIWKDQWSWTPVPQKVTKSLAGVLIQETISPNTNAGRPVTLDCSWQPMANITILESLRDRDTQRAMDLTLCDGTNITVIWDHSVGNPVQVNPIVERPDYTAGGSVDPDWYITVLYLIQSTG